MTSKKRTNEEIHSSLLESIGTIGALAEKDDVDGELLENAKLTATTLGIPLDADALHAFILGMGMGVVMQGETEDDRKEKAKPILKRIMYLHKLAKEGRL